MTDKFRPWLSVTVDEAVKMFHRARKHPDNEGVELAVIAIRCCNTAFQDRSRLICGDKEATARAFAQMAYERMNAEIMKVLTEPEEEEERVA